MSLRHKVEEHERELLNMTETLEICRDKLGVLMVHLEDRDGEVKSLKEALTRSREEEQALRLNHQVRGT